MPDSDESVARYYDANTKRFLAFGHGKAARALHRAVWGEGIASRDEAMNYVNELVFRDMQQCQAGFAVDLGCGVGGSLLYLAQRSASLSGHGITLSRVQARLGTEIIKEASLEERLRIVQGDILDVASYGELLTSRRSDLVFAFAIESLIHLESPDLLFRTLSQLLRRGERFAVCDDFFSSRLPSKTRKRPVLRRRIDEFRSGWKVRHLAMPEQLIETAQNHGFDIIRRADLTPYLELDRPRDRLIRILVALGRPFKPGGQWWSNLLGGNALQACIRAGIVEYWYLLFEKT
jgi:cyclopropane fatty-acyl-phospholipid synthase-like methyltransferase